MLSKEFIASYAQIVAKNLKRIVYESGKTQAEVARDLGINKSTLSNWMSGTRIPKMDSIDMLCNYFNVRRSDIMEEHKPGEIRKCDCARIPIVGRVAAGMPLLMVEEIEDYEEVPERLLETGNYVAMRIHGISMEPRICDGDLVIVREQDCADDGQIVIAAVNGDDATCKKIRRRNGQICLMSFNPAYPPQWYMPEEVEIKGLVVELRAKM